MRYSALSGLLSLALASVVTTAGEISFLEDFALAPDRAEAIKQLIPGTEDFYYYQALHYQNQGQFAQVEETLAAWIKRYGHTAQVEEIRKRQALLKYDTDPKGTLDFLKREINIPLHHQREILGLKPTNPTKLNQNLFSRDTLKKRAFAIRSDLSEFEDSAFDLLINENLNGDLRRDLIRRLPRPDYPNLAKLVNDDLSHPNSAGFGAFPIHRQMLLAQLDELLALRPGILNETNFVNIYMAKLVPAPEVDWQHDTKAREAYLERLWAFAKRLAPAHNSLKAHVLYQRLAHDRALGVYDNARFLEYIQLPRAAGYMKPEYLQRNENRDVQANLGMDFRSLTLCPPIFDDEALVRDYLMNFFVAAESYEPYMTYIRDDYLKPVFAETKILNGIGDMEKWYSLLNNPGLYQALKERIEIEFSPANKTFFQPDEPVGLDVDIKNVKTLIVKVFEINTPNYYRDQQREIGTDINLDGLIAGQENTVTYADPPLRRIRRHFDFPNLNRRGVFVIEFIGNGKSSRALVRKGQFGFIERSSAAGHVFSVIDEARQRVPGATLWLAGHEYTPEKDGSIVVPYTNAPCRQSILLTTGNFATLDSFQHNAENYSLTAGIYVDRETLLKRRQAQVLVRPVLFLNGVPVALSLFEDVALVIESTDLDGVRSSKEVRNFKLTADQEAVYEFQVPENIVTISFTLKGRVQHLSRNQKIDLADSATFQLNQIDATEKIEDMHLSQLPGGYVLQLLGKSGEAMPDRPVRFVLKHREFRSPVDVMLQTEATGRIDLGAMQDIQTLQAQGPDGTAHTWILPQDTHTYPAAVTARFGESILIPYMGKAVEAVPAQFSLLEKRGGTYCVDQFPTLLVRDGFLEIKALPAGDFDLVLKESNVHIQIVVGAGEPRDGYILGENRLLEIRNPAPLQIAAVEVGEKDIRVRLKNASGFTRVHVAATRFLPAYSLFGAIAAPAIPEPSVVSLSKTDSFYVSGRDIGDEYRYILERKYAGKIPGNMLARPSLLLNPWAVRTTDTGMEALAGGSDYAGYAGGEKSEKRSYGGKARLQAAAGGDFFAGLDFLPKSAIVLANLQPDKDGVIVLSREKLGDGQQVHVVAVNPDNVAYREVALPEVPLLPQDLRLADGLDPARHFTEQKLISVVEAGKTLAVSDITTSTVELYDTIGKVYRLYSTLSHDPALAEFAFILTWPQLKPEEKREKYSKYACHELSFFLSRKDPGFFETVILPYLRNKKDKTFLDHWLIGDDLASYLQPWAYEQLNIVERILLAQRVKDEAPAAARHVKDLQDLLPPDLDRFNQLFLTAIQGSALETGDALGLGEARDKASDFKALRREASAERELAQEGGKKQAASKAASALGVASPAKPGAAPPAPAANRARAASKDVSRMIENQRKNKQDLAQGLVNKLQADGPADEARDGDLGIDADRRADIRQLYRRLDKTQEWAENNYWHLPIAAQNASLVTVSPFWLDYSLHSGQGPFFSTRFAYASRNFTEMMFALAVLELPFDAKAPEAVYNDAKMTLTAKSPLVALHQEIRESAPTKDAMPLLVSQNFFRASDRYRFENAERYDKYVVEEFLVHVLYGCQVVLTNPTSSPQKLQVLLQVPRGAVPAQKGFYTKGRPIQMAPYSTMTFEYYFYFPAPGSFAHYPVHVAKNEQFLAAAAPVTLKVVETPTKIDTTSWDHVSQNGTPEEVLTFLDKDNPNRLNLDRIAWRMPDAPFFGKVIALLSRRHVYSHTLWGYGVLHNDLGAIREFLQHADGFIGQCGAYLDCKLVSIDPIIRKSYQHLEYSPLVNARAHQVGKRRQILNDAVSAQYHALLKVLSYRPKFDVADRLSVTYYMLLQDRVEEARTFFAAVDPKQNPMQLQYDYLQAYLDFYTPDHKLARAIAGRYADYPVDRWRNVFRDVVAQLDEVDGKGAAVIDKESREQAQAKLAASEPSFDFAVEARKISINYQNLTECRVNYYLMDIELLFSRNPFVQQYTGQFAYIQPNLTATVKLPVGKGTLAFDLPEQFRNANVMVEILAGGVKKSQAYYANSLALQVIENYGQIKVSHLKTGAPLAKVYVKVYARLKTGAVQFYKDGYTDLRGRFDYTSLNTNEIELVERFSVLVLSETDGAVIREAAPPKQ